jgi:hypothetical protein
MAGLNDTLTLGLILVLLFGAASLYLYTRIQQCEQKLNLVESILLDIKMSAELQGYPEPPPIKHVEVVPPSTKASPFVSMDEQEMYQGALDEALDGVESMPLEESTEQAIPTASLEQGQGQEQEQEREQPTKVTTNFESMTLAELKGIAKQRGLSGISSMKRSQLLEALKPKGPPADGGILSALAEQGSPVESS